MFKSIKWKFILVYFLLVFIAMVIIGVFILQKFEIQQLEFREAQMSGQIENIISTSRKDFVDSDLLENRKIIQDKIDSWNIDALNTLYIIAGDRPKEIIASSQKDYVLNLNDGEYELIEINAESYPSIDSYLLSNVYESEKLEIRDIKENTGIRLKHMAYPIKDDDGIIKGVAYMTSNLDDIYRTLDGSKSILINATFLALSITVVLGFLIASSITDPIRDVTTKAEQMAKGDFDQYVEVKSDDEIGQLANMFNFLTKRLKGSIQEIELERSKLNTIFKYMADGVIAIDKNNNIIHANPIALEILKIEDIDMNFKENNIITKDILNLEELDYTNLESLEKEENIYIDSNIYRLRYAPFRNEKSVIEGIIVVFQDITEQQRLDNMRREFVANVSHELKTPITTIKSYTETLIEYDDLSGDTSKGFLDIIDKECDRMNKILRDLLLLSNMDYKKTVWEKSQFKVLELIDDIILKLRLALEEKNQEIEVFVEDNLPDIFADRDGLQQVLINIIFNAIKYTEKNGIIKVSSFIDKNKLIIRVKDNGIGIPEEDQRRIFERFYRVDKGRARLSGGSGLGLSIAKQIIEEQDGEIILKSEMGKGTEVDIILPLA